MNQYEGSIISFCVSWWCLQPNMTYYGCGKQGRGSQIVTPDVQTEEPEFVSSSSPPVGTIPCCSNSTRRAWPLDAPGHCDTCSLECLAVPSQVDIVPTCWTIAVVKLGVCGSREHPRRTRLKRTRWGSRVGVQP